MLLSIVAGLMVILVAAFWVYQGFFSSLIMFLDTVVACMIAFGFYEPLHAVWADSEAMQGIGRPVALMLIFVATLVVLRVATDKIVPDGVSLQLETDRTLGGVCGFFTGMILVGTGLVAVQMLPTGPSVLGYSRFVADAEGRTVKKGLGFRSDEFTVGMVNMLSAGGFGGGNPFGQAKPGLLDELYARRAVPQVGARVRVPEDCLRVIAYWEASQINELRQRMLGAELKRDFTPVSAEGFNKFLVCRVQLNPSAAAKEDQKIRFRVPQFRVVGPPPAGAGESEQPTELILACGMSDVYTHKGLELANIAPGQANKLVRFSPETDLILGPEIAKSIQQGGKGYEFDVVFEVPQDFVPWHIAFKDGAVAEITRKMSRKESPGPLGSGSAAAPSEPTAEHGQSSVEVGAAPAGRTHFADAIEERTGVSSRLPLPLDGSVSFVARSLRGGKLHEGHFWVEVPENPEAVSSVVTEFAVPSGKVMVQVGAEQNMPESMFGKALNYAAAVASQISVRTSDGRQYYAQGVYSAAPVGGKMIFEIQYWPNAEIPERCLKTHEPKKLTKSVMENANPESRKFGYLFLVDPGVEITMFSPIQNKEQALKITVPG
ncbi:MAG: CvpA family protein [Planctomycetota bacterium]